MRKFPNEIKKIPFYSMRGRVIFYSLANDISRNLEGSDLTDEQKSKIKKNVHDEIELYEKNFKKYQNRGEEAINSGPTIEKMVNEAVMEYFKKKHGVFPN
jgi:predicted nucleotidyltransferase